jgi:hypothetical protein
VTPLVLADIPAPEVFLALRSQLREAILAHKTKRRVAVGANVTLLFEDRETLRWQVLEMCRVEGTRDAASIQREIDVYNELLPGSDELSATLFIEITDLDEIRPALDRLLGLDAHVALWIGDTEVRASFDPGQMEEERISAVHYLRFALPAGSATLLRDPAVPVRIRVDHPSYQAETSLEAATRESLAGDLDGDPEPLVDFEGAVAPPREQVVLERGAVHAVRPARPLAREHIVVAPSGPAPPFAEAPEELLMACMALAREIARELAKSHGACRIALDATGPLALDVFVPRD